MARLPSRADFGARPTPTAPRSIVPVRTGIAEQAAADTGRAITRTGQQTFEFGTRLGDAEARIRTREEAVAAMGAVSAYNEAVSSELRRVQVEEDLADLGVTKGYGDFLRTKKAEILNGFQGSEIGRLRLEERLEGIRSSYIGQAGALGAEAGRKRVMTVVGNQIQSLAASAADNPTKLPELYESFDSIIDDGAPGLKPEDEVALRASGRQEITLSAVNALVARGSVDEAKEIFYNTPGLREMMTPAQLRLIETQFTAYDRKIAEARLEGEAKLASMTAFLGRPPTMAERLMSEGLVSATPKFQTDVGKYFADREIAVGLYGPNSPQVQALDEAARAKTTGEGPKLSDVKGIRQQFTQGSTDFIKVRDSYNRIVASATDPSPAGDLTLMFNYMKMLDPGSVVRESEFAQVAATGSLGQQLQASALRYLSGERLTDTQRKDFQDRAADLMTQQLKSQIRLEDQYRGIAERAKVNAADVVVDFVGPEFRKAIGQSGDNGGNGPSLGKPRMKFDLEGNPIGQATETKKSAG